MSDLIYITRYNAIQSRIQAVLGTSNTGYGQPVSSTQLVKNPGVPLLIEASAMNKLRGDLFKARVHQTGTTLADAVLPLVAPKVTKISNDIFANYEACMKAIEDNRYTMASNQSYTTAVAQTSTRTTPWNTTISHVVKVTFNSPLDANYFFNAGGVFIITPAFTPSASPNAKTSNWKSLIDSVGAITINRVDFSAMTGTLSPIKTVSGTGSYSSNKFIVKVQFVTNVLTISIEFQDNVGSGAGFDDTVSGTLSSSVGYTVAKSDVSFSLGSVVSGTFQPNFSMVTDTRLDQTGVSAGYAVSLTPATLVVSEGNDVTINIATNQAPSNTIWYKITGEAADNTPISTADFDNMPSLVNQVTVGLDGNWSGTWKVATDPTTDPTSMDVTLYASDPRLSPTPAVLATTAGKTPSQSMWITDTIISVTLQKLTPAGSSIGENSQTATFQFTTTDNPPSATWSITTSSGIDLNSIFVNTTGIVTPIANNTGQFTITSKPNHKATGDTPITVKVTVGSYESNPIQMTVFDDSKPIIAYHTTRDPNSANDPTKGTTAWTYDNNLSYTITGGMPDTSFTFTRGSDNPILLQLDANGTFPYLGFISTFNGLPSPGGNLPIKIKFFDETTEYTHTINFEDRVQALKVTAIPPDIFDGMTTPFKIDFELSECYAKTKIHWTIDGTPAGIYQGTTLTSGDIEVDGTNSAGVGSGSLILTAISSTPNYARGSSFTVTFSLPTPTTVPSLTTSTIRIIDAFPYYTTSTTPVHVYLPTAATRTTIEARGGGGGGAGANSFTNASNSGTVANGKGGSGGSAATIVSTHDILKPELVVTRGLAGKGGKSRLLTAGAAISGDGGAGGYSGGAGGAGGGGTAGSGAGGGGGGASTVTVLTTTLLIAGGAGGGGGGANNSPGGAGASTAGLTTTMPKTAGGAGATNAGSGVSGGGGGGGNGGLGGNYGQDSVYGNTDATGGTAGSLSYHNGTKVGLPVLLYKYSAGGIGALNLSNQDGTTGVDGEVIIYVQPMAPQYPVAAMQPVMQPGASEVYIVDADPPLKYGSSSIITDYTITSTVGNSTGSLPTTGGTFVGATGQKVTFTLTANNSFGTGVPITVPVQTARLSNQATFGSKCGFSVSMSGDGTRMVVGAPYYANKKGAAFVYARMAGENVWTYKTTLSASNGADGDQFGFSVDIDQSGERIVVGAPYKDYNSQTDQGGVYIFKRTGVMWTEEKYIDCPNGSGGFDDHLGYSVKISSDGTFVLAGLPGADTPNTAVGLFRAYYLSELWATDHNMPSNATEPNANIGSAVTISTNGMWCAVGGPGDANQGWYSSAASGISNAGSVSLFNRSTTTSKSWSAKKFFCSPTPIVDGNFGTSIALNDDGTILVIGAPGETAHGLAKAGTVHIFTGSGTTWDIQTMLTASNPQNGANFGYSVTIVGDTILVGANNASAGSGTNRFGSGIVYKFVRTGTTWTESMIITQYNKVANDSFGASVSMNSTGDLAAIGAPNPDISSTGAAYTFQL